MESTSTFWVAVLRPPRSAPNVYSSQAADFLFGYLIHSQAAIKQASASSKNSAEASFQPTAVASVLAATAGMPARPAAACPAAAAAAAAASSAPAGAAPVDRSPAGAAAPALTV
jgi:hypothetical protein